MFIRGGEGDGPYGHGFTYAIYVHGSFLGTAAAWVADVAFNWRIRDVAVPGRLLGDARE